MRMRPRHKSVWQTRQNVSMSTALCIVIRMMRRRVTNRCYKMAQSLHLLHHSCVSCQTVISSSFEPIVCPSSPSTHPSCYSGRLVFAPFLVHVPCSVSHCSHSCGDVMDFRAAAMTSRFSQSTLNSRHSPSSRQSDTDTYSGAQ